MTVHDIKSPLRNTKTDNSPLPSALDNFQDSLHLFPNSPNEGLE